MEIWKSYPNHLENPDTTGIAQRQKYACTCQRGYLTVWLPMHFGKK